MTIQAYETQKQDVISRIEVMLGEAHAWLALAKEQSAMPQSIDERVQALASVLSLIEDALFTVAFVGPFSSGKTMLISALLHQIDASIDDSDGTWTWDTRLLPSDSTPTTSRPLEIRHAAIERLLVRFVGNVDYEELPATKEFLGATVGIANSSTIANFRNVQDAILETPDVPFPGRLLDLPGTQSPRPEDEQIVVRNLGRADCFVFVLSAARSVDGLAVQQLDDLYQIFLTENKPVFFALTQVDSHMNKKDGQYAWERSLHANNSLLNEIFVNPATKRPNLDFIGRGFLPVAAISTAKQRYLANIGESDRVVDAELRVGNPARLVRDLNLFFYEEVGPRRLARILDDARLICRNMEGDMTAVADTLAMPWAELDDQERILGDALGLTSSERPGLELEIRDVFQGLLQESFSGPVVDDLKAALVKDIDPVIMSTKKFDTKILEQIEVLANAVVAEWTQKSPRSPLRRWSGRERERIDHAVARFSDLLGTQARYTGEGSDLDLIQLANRINAERPASAVATLGEAGAVFTKALGALGGAAVVGAAGVLGLGGLIAIFPVGAALGTVAIWYGLRRRRSDAERAQATRQSLRDYLSGLAEQRVEAMQAVCEERALHLGASFSQAIDVRAQRLRDELLLIQSQREGERPRKNVIEQMREHATSMMRA